MRHATRQWSLGATALALLISVAPAFADEEAAKRWIDSEFQPSTLSKDDQLKEMQWFIKAASLSRAWRSTSSPRP